MNKIRARPVSDPPGALRATGCRPEPTSSEGFWPREGDDTPRSCHVDPDFPGNPTGNTRLGDGVALLSLGPYSTVPPSHRVTGE